ncbi:IclR family transcriptional regulator C-terminal domain-containing protein [Nocardioides sp. zg-1228]|uniref:IclR family transcriptional regulator domain-containing protein n=1 Tax=Nocardioides sp. zg-1228 TaxID=2763008 RepID=UPI00197E2F61|nr:IclR family transcriptional regulator C-terminal domain-containing protein [Nocardioides sp. zg-1228]QSF58595.1 helix-turn-helix domain-containing protein [Nocardioides sp. zg-1228]
MRDRPSAGGEFVQSLARGLDVIRAFDADRPAMTLSEVADVTGLSRAAARRFLLTLVELGFVRYDGKHFALTPRVLRLGTAYLSGLQLPEIARPHLEALSAQVGESTSLGVLDGTDVVYVARVASRSIMNVAITVGTRFPAHATSMGRVLLAGLSARELDDWFAGAELTAVTQHTPTDEGALRRLLDAAAEQGWAANDQELAPGLRSIAAPVRDRSGHVVAAVNVSSTVLHDPQAEYLESLLGTADAVSADLGHSG